MSDERFSRFAGRFVGAAFSILQETPIDIFHLGGQPDGAADASAPPPRRSRGPRGKRIPRGIDATVAQERVQQREDGLVRITLKKPYADGTVGVDMDPRSLLGRLATSVPPPRLHTVHYAGVLAPASQWRSRLVLFPRGHTKPPAEGDRPGRSDNYRLWAQLLARSFAVDVLTPPRCQGRMKLFAIVKDEASIARYLSGEGKPTEAPDRSPNRGPPYWKSRVLRRLGAR